MQTTLLELHHHRQLQEQQVLLLQQQQRRLAPLAADQLLMRPAVPLPAAAQCLRLVLLCWQSISRRPTIMVHQQGMGKKA
jgi:hypothetical protein